MFSTMLVFVFSTSSMASIPLTVSLSSPLDLHMSMAMASYSPVVSQTAAPSIGPLWVAAYAPDGDGLATLAFPSSVSGSGILLASVSLSADTIGQTALWISTTPGDLNEGFALASTGFADLTFESGHVTVTPEPGSLALLATATLVFRRRKRR